MTENDYIRYIKDVESEANEDQMERFVSYGEIFEKLGFPVKKNDSELYEKGWYKGEIMSWDRYLFERYKEEHPDDPNVKRFDPSRVLRSALDDSVLGYFDFK